MRAIAAIGLRERKIFAPTVAQRAVGGARALGLGMLGKQITIAAVIVIGAMLAANFLAKKTPPLASAQRAKTERASPPEPARLAVRRDEQRIAADAAGQFSTEAEVNGARISRMLVDTGASSVALSYEDAAAAGVFPAPADYKYEAQTANGVAHVARVTLGSVKIGNLLVHDVDAFVGEQGALNGSLLGMTFLSRLSRVSVESGALVLKQ